MERESILQVDAEAIVSDAKPATFKQGPVGPPESDHILVRDTITSIPISC